jgi:drug/metabolite transporter (DMT)-like permease
MRQASLPAASSGAPEPARTALVWCLIGAVTVLWGVNWPAMKVGVSQIEPWLYRVLCVFGAGVTLLLLARLRGERVLFPRARLWPMLGVALGSVTGWHMFTAYGLLHMGSGRASIVAFTMPVWASLLGVLVLNERFTARRVAGLALGMGGLAILLGDDVLRFGERPLGLVLMLAAAITWAAGTIGTKAYDWGVGVLTLSGWQLLIGGVPILAVWAAQGAALDFSRVDATGLFSLLYTIFVALVFCYTAYLQLVRLLPASVAAISTLAIPVVGLVSSAIWLGEPVGLAEIAALLLVLAAMALVLLPSRANGR